MTNKKKNLQKNLYLDIIKNLKLSKRKGHTLKKMFERDHRNLTLGILSHKSELDREISIYEHSYVNRGQNYEDMAHIKNSMYLIDQSPFPAAEYKKGQWIGVEIECTMPYPKRIKHRLDRDEYFDNLNSTCYKHIQDDLKKRNMRFVEVKYDGSIHIEHDNHFKIEFTLCFMNDDKGFNKLKQVCDYLTEMKAVVNKSCGLHIHLDMRGLAKETVQSQAIRLINALPALYRLVPGTRMNNRYCKMNKEFNWRPNDKYYAVNMMSYSNYQTIEIRLHSGTTNYEKISNWIKLLWTIKEAKEFTNTQLTISKNPTAYLFDAINLSSDIQRFYYKREVMFDESNRQDSELGESQNDISSGLRPRARIRTNEPIAATTPLYAATTPLYEINYSGLTIPQEGEINDSGLPLRVNYDGSTFRLDPNMYSQAINECFSNSTQLPATNGTNIDRSNLSETTNSILTRIEELQQAIGQNMNTLSTPQIDTTILNPLRQYQGSVSINNIANPWETSEYADDDDVSF